MIIHLATLVLAFKNSLFHYPQWCLAFHCRKIFLVSYPLWPHLKWALKSMDWTDFSALWLWAYISLGIQIPSEAFGLFASHDFNSHRSHLVTILEKPAETAGLEWAGKTTTINLFFAAELAPTVWPLTGGSRKRHWMSILSPAAWTSEAFGFPPAEAQSYRNFNQFKL